MKIFQVCVLVKTFENGAHHRPEEGLTSPEEAYDPEGYDEECFSDEEDDDETERLVSDDNTFQAPHRSQEKSISDALKKLLPLLSAVGPSCMALIVLVKRLARTHAGKLSANILRAENFYTIFFKGRRMDLSNISRVVTKALSELEKLIQYLSLGADTSLEFGQIVDDLVSGEFKHTDELAGSRLIERVLSDGDFKQLATTGRNGSIFFNTIWAQDYLEKVNEVNRLLLVLVHILSGLPGRATELATLRLRQAPGSQRNVFVETCSEGAFLMFRGVWGKSNWTGKTPDLVRYLDEHTSNLTLRFIFFIRPFAHAIAASSRSQRYSGAYLDYLFVWEGRSMTATVIRRIFSDYLSKFNLVLSFAEYRHIAKYIIRESYMQAEIETYGRTMKIEKNQQSKSAVLFENLSAAFVFKDMQPKQFGHSEHTGSQYGAINGAHFPANEIERRYFFIIGKFWIQSIRNFGINPTATFIQKTLPSSELVLTDKEAKTLKKTSLIPGNQETHVHFSINVDVKRNTETSFLSILTDTPLSDPVSVKNSRKRIADPSSGNKAQQLLNRHFPNLDWRSPEQFLAVKHSLSLWGNFLCILPTSGGKSLTFLFTCLAYPDALVATLVPTCALQQDCIRRATEFGILCTTDIAGYKRGLLVITFADFQTHLNMFLAIFSDSQRRRRIFIDECHLLLSQAFQNPACAYPVLLSTGVPIGLLTATADEAKAETLKKLFLGSDGVIIRSSTDRKNLEYNVHACENRNAINNLLFSELTASFQLESTGKVVIYVPRVNMVRQLHDTLQNLATVPKLAVGMYYGGIEDAESIVQGWFSGNFNIIISTSAFGLGIDCSQTRCVIMFELPYTLEDMIQMAGRQP
jgi:hypothetical protein